MNDYRNHANDPSGELTISVPDAVIDQDATVIVIEIEDENIEDENIEDEK